MIPRTLGTRRAPALAAGTLVALATLSACGEGDTGPGNAEDKASDDTVAECQSAAPSGSFDYTDSRDQTVSLDSIPSTVVAQSSVAAALWDAGYQVDGVYGELGDDPASTYQRGNLVLDDMVQLGSTWGEFDVDAYAQMEPDLLVDYSFDGSTLWYVPSKQAKQIGDRAPSIAVNGNPTNLDDAITSFVDLAAQLGVDTKCNAKLDDARDEYDEALAEVTEAGKDLKVVIMSATDENFYVVNPEMLPETGTLSQAGVEFVAPKTGEPNIFHEMSWERAADYAEADVVLIDARNTESVRKKMESIDTFANLPAVKAGQVYEWYAAAPYSYKVYADIFDELADDLEDSQPIG